MNLRKIFNAILLEKFIVTKVWFLSFWSRFLMFLSHADYSSKSRLGEFGKNFAFIVPIIFAQFCQPLFNSVISLLLKIHFENGRVYRYRRSLAYSGVYFWTFKLWRFDKLLSSVNKVEMVFDQATRDFRRWGKDQGGLEFRSDKKGVWIRISPPCEWLRSFIRNRFITNYDYKVFFEDHPRTLSGFSSCNGPLSIAQLISL